jgi:hypothetical protein
MFARQSESPSRFGHRTVNLSPTALMVGHFSSPAAEVPPWRALLSHNRKRRCLHCKLSQLDHKSHPSAGRCPTRGAFRSSKNPPFNERGHRNCTTFDETARLRPADLIFSSLDGLAKRNPPQDVRPKRCPLLRPTPTTCGFAPTAIVREITCRHSQKLGTERRRASGHALSEITQLRRLEPVRQRKAAVDHDGGAGDVGRHPV